MSQPVSLQELKDQFTNFKKEFENGLEPLQVIQQIHQTLEKIAENPQEELYSNSNEVRKFFFEEYVGGITKRITQTRSSDNEQYLQEIREIYLLFGQLFLNEIKINNSDMADAMRAMFDTTANTHQNNFQPIEEIHTSHYQEVESIFSKLSEEEKEWRLQLKEGSQIDAVKIENDSNDYQLKEWSKGVISRMIGNGRYFMVSFENDVDTNNRDFPIYSSEIAPYNTMSAGDEWRLDLQVDEMIDAYDSTKVWYSSTIVDKEVRNIDGKEILYYKVGFRQYSPEGNRGDIGMPKYFGWSEHFDEWLTSHNPRIQQYQHFAKVWDQSLQSSSQYDDLCDDSMDLLLYKHRQNSQIIYAIERKKCKSILLLEFINQFGRKGGFELIYNKIKYDQDVGLDLIFYYLDCIANCYQVLNREFLQEYKIKLLQAIRDRLLNASEQQIKQVRRDRIDQIVSLMINVLEQRFKTQKQRDQDRNLLNLEIGCVLLKKNFMERRIDGAKLIQEVCKIMNNVIQNQVSDSLLNNSLKQQQNVFHQRLIIKLKEEDVLQQIFSKDRIHQELVQRSEELLKLLFSQNAMSQDELNLIWSATIKGEESIKLQIYKLFVEIASKIKMKDITFIIEKLSQKSSAIKEEIELVHEMARRTSSIELAQVAVEYLWKIAMNSYDKFDKQLVNHAAMSLSEIIKYWNIESKLPYIYRLLQNLIDVSFYLTNYIQILFQNKEGLLSIKILLRVLKDIINYQSGQSCEQELEDLTEYNKKKLADIENDELYGEGSANKNQKNKDKELDQYEKESKQPDINDLLEMQPLNQQQSHQNNQNNNQQNSNNNNNNNNGSVILDQINAKYDILQIFFSNFQNYMERARAVLQSKMEENPSLEISSMHDKCLTDKFMHSDQLTERMEFIKFVAGNSQNLKISQEMLSTLWDEMVVLSLIHNDQEVFYRWLREVCDLHTQNCQVVEIDILINFFKQKMSKSQNAFLHITVEGFNCLQSLFILLNEQEKRVVRLGAQAAQGSQYKPKGSKFTSFSNTGGAQYNNFSFNNNKTQNIPDPDETEISVLVHPEELEGIDGIWKIATMSNDKKVCEKASTFLVKLYTKVAYRNEHRVPEFEDCFIDKCFHGIQEQLAIIDQRKPEVKKEEPSSIYSTSLYTSSASVTLKLLPQEEKKIMKYMSLLRNLIKNSDKEGPLGVKPHAALFKGEYLHTIQINNSLKNSQQYLQKIEIGCYSNTTLWELRKAIGERGARLMQNDGTYIQDTPVHPLSVRIYRYTGTTDLKDYENGKTLGELRFKPNETLSAFKNNMYQSIKEPLLNEHLNDLSDRARMIFSGWFNTYSIDDPEEPGTRIMNPKTCAEFTRTCTDDYCTEEDNRVTSLFVLYDRDRDNKILLEDFLDFFRDSIQEKEEVVRQNLYYHNYKYDLRKVVKDSDDEFFMQVRKVPENMPRYKIANNPEQFNLLFRLLEKQGELAQQSWKFLKTIATNPTIYQRVQNLDKNQQEQFSWEDIFESSSIYKMLYQLQILESFLEDSYSAGKDSNGNEETWIAKFLKLDGFQQILQLFQKSVDLLSGKSPDSLNRFEKLFLESMLRLIKIFMISAFSQVQGNNAADVLELVQKKSSTNNADNGQVTESNNNQQLIEEAHNEDENQFKTPQKQFKPQEKYGVNQRRNLNVQFQEPTGQVNEQALYETLFGEDQQIQKDNALDAFAGSNKHTAQNVSEQFQSSSKFLYEQNSTAADLKDLQKFSELVNVMKFTGLSEQILAKIQFSELQNQVLEIVCLMLNKKDMLPDDLVIIENSMNLWVASVLQNQNLIDEFYKYHRDESRAGKYGIKNAEEFILSGIYSYKKQKIREDFCNSLFFICSKVQNVYSYYKQFYLQLLQNQGRLPLFYILDLLKNNFPREDQYYARRECQQFFDLLNKLVDEYFKFESHEKFEQGAFDPCDLLSEIIDRLKRHESKEKKGSYLEDKTMIGYMDLIKKLMGSLNLTQKDKLLKVLKYSDFLHEIFYECIFYDPKLTRSPNQNKCKTKEARFSVFLLMSKFIECMDIYLLDEFLKDYLLPLIKDVKRPKKWQYVAQETTKSCQFSGIVNLGCICYMNSMLQQFFMVPAFRFQLLKAVDKSPKDIVEYKGLQIDDSLLRQLQKLFGYLEMSERQAYDPTEFCFAFKDIEGNPTNISLQQDAQEFLSIFFDRLEELLKPTSQKFLLQDVFGFKLCSQIICQSCGNIRNLLEHQYNLSLQVKDRKGVDDSLSKMIEGSIINDFNCENCKSKVDIVKRSLIADMPNVLIVHLQRIIFDFDIYQNNKINTRFEFPHVLRLADYSFKNVMKNENKLTDEMLEGRDDLKELMNITDEEYTYKLVGVTIHVGTAEHGHYYSLINVKRGSEEVDEDKIEWQQIERDTWKQFEDDKVTSYMFSSMKSDAFGGGYHQTSMNDNEMNAYLTNTTGGSFGKNAYMLVYERMKKKPLRQVITEEDSKEQQLNGRQTNNASLECINTATSRAASQDPNDQSTAIVNFRKVQPYVPSWIKDLVNEDNSSNLVDVQIYHEHFFNLIKNTIKHIPDNILGTQHHYQLDSLPTFIRIKRNGLQLTKKSMFDILAYCFHNTQMSNITSSFGSLIQYCDSYYSLKMGDESLLLEFINECFLDDNCQHFFNIMFNCTDNTSRLYIGRLATSVINKAFSVCNQMIEKGEQATEKSNELLEAAQKFLYLCVIALQTSECQKNWSRLQAFFYTIQEVGMGSPLQSHFLLSKFDIVVDLIDFMLGNKSPLALEKGEKRPNMGAGASFPPFEPLVILLSYLIRFMFTEEMKVERKEWNNTFNPPPHTLLGYTLNTLLNNNGESQQQDKEDLWEEKYPLSQTAYNFFTHQDFIEKILKEGYQCEDYGQAIAHFCYKNQEFSKRIAKFLIKGISKNDFDRMKNYLDVVIQVSLVRDDLQRMRLEWIFGIGLLNSQTVAIDQATNQINATKLGIQTLHYITDEVYSYKSALQKSDSDDALLELLWRYKGRIDTYAVNCLLSLVKLLSLDDNVAEFFSTLPGPTYCYARYTDWIKPYLNEQLLSARRGFHGSLSQNKEEIVVSVLSLYEKYEQFLRQKDQVTENYIQQEEEVVPTQQQYEINKENEQDDEEADDEGEENQDNSEQEENVMNLIKKEPKKTQKTKVVTSNIEESNNLEQKQALHCEPRPYVIISALSDQQQINFQQDFNEVVLTIAKIPCQYTLSYPTGSGNLSIPTKVLKKPNMRFQGGGISIGVSNRTDIQMQNRYMENQFQSSKIKPRYQNNQDSKQEENGNTAKKAKMYNDDNNQWQNINKEHQDEEQMDNFSDQADRMAGQSDNEGNESDYQDTFNQGFYDADKVVGLEEGQIIDNYQDQQNQQQTTQSCQIKVVEQKDEEMGRGGIADYNDVTGGLGSQTTIESRSGAIEDNDRKNRNNNIQVIEVDEDPSQINWPYGINTCNDLVYKFSVVNNRNFTIKCQLQITLKENCEEPNLYWPRAGVRTLVYPHQTKTLLVLPKIIPCPDCSQPEQSEYLKLDIKFFWTASKRMESRVGIYPSTSSHQDFQASRRPGIIIDTSNLPRNINNNSGTGIMNKLNLNLAPTIDEQVYAEETGIVQEGANNEGTTNQSNTVENDNQPSDQKQCPQCTLYNEIYAVKCEVCEFDLV